MEELLQEAANTKDKKLKQRLQRTAALTQEKLNQNRNNTRGDAFYQMLMVRFPDQFNEISRLNNELALLETTYNDLVSQKTGTAKDVKAAESLRAQMESMLQQKLDLEAQFESESVELTQQEEFEFTRILTEEGLSRIKNTLEIFDGEIDTMRANNVDESKIKEMQDRRDSVKKMYDEALRIAGEVDAARKQVEALSDQALETQKQTLTQEQAEARRNVEQQESMVEEASPEESLDALESRASAEVASTIADTSRRLSGRDESLKISTEELTAAKERLFNAESELAGMLDMADIVSNIGVPTDTGKAAQQKAKDRRSAIIDGRPRRRAGS